MVMTEKEKAEVVEMLRNELVAVIEDLKPKIEKMDKLQEAFDTILEFETRTNEMLTAALEIYSTLEEGTEEEIQ